MISALFQGISLKKLNIAEYYYATALHEDLGCGIGRDNFSDDSAATIINTDIPFFILLSRVTHKPPKGARCFFSPMC